MNRNSAVAQNLIKSLRLQTAIGDNVVSKLDNKFSPIIDCSPFSGEGICRDNAVTNNLTATIFSVPNDDRDFYITACTISVVKDATSTATYAWISYQDSQGGSIHLCRIPLLTLTAERASLSITLKNPVKVAKGTNIVVSCSNGTANIQVAGQINGVFV